MSIAKPPKSEEDRVTDEPPEEVSLDVVDEAGDDGSREATGIAGLFQKATFLAIVASATTGTIATGCMFANDSSSVPLVLAWGLLLTQIAFFDLAKRLRRRILAGAAGTVTIILGGLLGLYFADSSMPAENLEVMGLMLDIRVLTYLSSASGFTTSAALVLYSILEFFRGAPTR